jgi:hypothetical protein
MIAPVVFAALAIASGPALTGPRVTWAAHTFALYSSNPVRRIWKAPSVEAPLFQRVGQIAASAHRVAFIRTVEFQPPCPAGDICPYRRQVVQNDLWSGPPRGPFKRVNHGLTLDVDIDGNRVLYSDTSRVVLGRTLAFSSSVEYPDVALAGHYAAWTEVSRGHNLLYVKRKLVVYDLRARRVAYRLDAAPFLDIDVAQDGTVAFGQDPTPLGGPDGASAGRRSPSRGATSFAGTRFPSRSGSRTIESRTSTAVTSSSGSSTARSSRPRAPPTAVSTSTVTGSRICVRLR